MPLVPDTTGVLSRALVLSGLICLPSQISCSSNDAHPDAGPPSLEIGSGNQTFEPLTDGDTIFVIQGPQGGYHLLGSLRANNINAGNADDLADPSNPTVHFEVFVGDVRVDSLASTYRQGLVATRDGDEMIGRFVILDIGNDSELDGETLKFVVRIEDADGVTISDERSLIGRPHPNNL